MSVSSFLHSVFAFRTVPTTVFIILLYAAAFISLYVTDQLPVVPSVDKQHGYGVDLETAYKDLHLVRALEDFLIDTMKLNSHVCPRHRMDCQIAARPHPYNSHENDRVREYVLGRVSQIAEGQEYITVLDDLNTTTSWTQSWMGAPSSTYFEGNNILVKVDGSEEDVEGS